MESAIAKAGAVGQSTLSGHKSLITDEPWDCYHLESVLPLKETYRENTEFGFLLRHYWIPATILTFRHRHGRRSLMAVWSSANWRSKRKWLVVAPTSASGAKRFALLWERTATARS